MNNLDRATGEVIEMKPVTTPTLADKYRLTTLTDLTLSGSNGYVLKGLAEAGALSCWYGAPGAGKSFLMLSVGIAIAQGADWMGLRTKRGAVFYIAAEGANGVRKRLEAAIQEGVLRRDAPFFLIPYEVDLFDKDANTQDLIKMINEKCDEVGQKPALVVVDTLARVLGSGDENSRDVQEVCNNAGRLQAETGAHVALVHHSGKNEDAGARGHSSLLGAVDAEIQITRDKEDQQRRQAKITKLKDGDDSGKSFPFTLKIVELGFDTDGDPITSCVVEAAEGENLRRGVKLTDKQALTFEYVKRCVQEHGVLIPKTEGFPTSQTYGVKMEVLVEHFVTNELIPQDDNKNKQNAALRSKIVALRPKGIINARDGWVWPC